MNDNGIFWRTSEFEITMADGERRIVRGSICGVFAIHDDRDNDIPSATAHRVSITHLPSGRFIGRAPNGAAAYEIVEQLVPMEDEFARALHGRDLRAVANRIADIFDARGAYTNARQYA